MTPLAKKALEAAWLALSIFRMEIERTQTVRGCFEVKEALAMVTAETEELERLALDRSERVPDMRIARCGTC